MSNGIRISVNRTIIEVRGKKLFIALKVLPETIRFSPKVHGNNMLPAGVHILITCRSFRCLNDVMKLVY